jgi:hypothetical protein
MKNVTKPSMNPMLALFLKLTGILVIAIVAIVVAGFLLKIAIIAAVLAAIGVGVFFLYNLIRRRTNFPVIR